MKKGDKIYIIDQDLVQREREIVAVNSARPDKVLIESFEGNGYITIHLRGGLGTYFSLDFSGKSVFVSDKPVSLDDPKLDKLKLRDRESLILLKEDTYWSLIRSNEVRALKYKRLEDLRKEVFVFRDAERLKRFLGEETGLLDKIVGRAQKKVDETKEKLGCPDLKLSKEEKAFIKSRYLGPLEIGEEYFLVSAQGLSYGKTIKIKKVLNEDQKLYLLEDGTYIGLYSYDPVYKLPAPKGRGISDLEWASSEKSALKSTLKNQEEWLRKITSFFEDPWNNDPCAIRIYGLDTKVLTAMKRKYNYRLFV